MAKSKMIAKKKIQEQIEHLRRNLENAERYLERGENVESVSFLHFADWRGNSGHPDWIRNKMIPTTKRAIARKEDILERMNHLDSQAELAHDQRFIVEEGER